MEIDIIDKRSIIEQHKDDLKNYDSFIQELADNSPQWMTFQEHCVPNNRYQLFHEIKRGEEVIGKIIPSFEGKEKAFYRLGIELYEDYLNPESFKQTAESKLKNCVGLEKITIETY